MGWQGSISPVEHKESGHCFVYMSCGHVFFNSKDITRSRELYVEFGLTLLQKESE